MQRTLEDEENYGNTSVDMDGVIGRTSARGKEVAGYHSNYAAKAGSVTSAQKLSRDRVQISSDETSVTEEHDCDVRSEECQNTQEAEFTSAYHDHGFSGGFGSPIDVVTEPMIEGDAVGTERVLETESPANCGRDLDLSKCDALGGDTMRFDDKYVNVQETKEHAQTTCGEVLHHSQSNNTIDRKTNDNTHVGETIRTTDLVTSEVGGSWACNTGPSVHGGNEYPRSRDKNAGSAALLYLNCMVAECQNTPDAASTGHNDERRAPNETIGVVCISDSETESCSDTGSDDIADAKGGSMSDAETVGGDHVEEDQKQYDSKDENDEATQENSVG